MSTSAPSMEHLIEKIRHLPAERMAEVEDFVDFLQQRANARRSTPARREPPDFPVISIGKWPQGLSLRREDMYGDDGR